jgi:hypothetical protein
MARTLLLPSRGESSRVSASVRGGTGGPFTLFSLVAAVYLIIALSVPGAYLIAKQASLAYSLQQLSLDRIGSNAGEEDGGDDTWPGPKRLRGALLLSNKAGLDKNFPSSLLPLYMFLGPPDRCSSPSCASRSWPRRHDRTKTERYPKNSSVEVRPRASSRGANTTTRDGFGRLKPPLA